MYVSKKFGQFHKLKIDSQKTFNISNLEISKYIKYVLAFSKVNRLTLQPSLDSPEKAGISRALESL